MSVTILLGEILFKAFKFSIFKMICLEYPTISFCENIHHHGFYLNFIAEFWNAISSFFFCFVSFYHLKNNKFHQLTPILTMAFYVGLGSFLFHAIPQRFFQFTDEIPMVLLITQAIYLINDELHLKHFNYTDNLYKFIVLLIDLLRLSVILSNIYEVYFYLFEILYITMIFIYVGMMYFLSWNHKKEISFTVSVGLFGYGFWLIDQHLCLKFFSWISLHSFWHFAMGCVIFNFVQFVKIYKIENSGRRIIINRKGPLFFYQEDNYEEFDEEL